ncbi:MAG: DUF349 domain-containing protein [Lishizhenia sp.]
MEKIAFIESLKALTASENILKVGKEVSELRVKFEDFLLEEGRKRQVAQLEAIDRDEVPEKEPTSDPLKDEFYEIYTAFKAKRKELIDAKNKVEDENLKRKRALITKLKAIVQEEENIGNAFKAHKEIHEAWKEIGEIPRDKRPAVQNEYSRLLEDFFYNMKIYREIKEYDFKKNLDAKYEIIAKIEALANVERIKDVEAALKILQNEWEDVGPAPQEEWETVKEKYWSNVKATWDRIQAFYDERNAQMEKNLGIKKELLEMAKQLAARENSTTKDWEDNTKILIEIQDTWKNVGFGPKKENEEIWKEFRAVCDSFFEEKSKFYEGINEVYDKVAAQKEKLVEKVEALKTSTDWKDTTQKIIGLQKEWKNLGSAGRKNEQRLWKSFRGACDSFFNAKQKHFEEMDKQNETNLAAKEAIIEQITSFDLPENKNEAIQQLKEFSKSFSEAGKVPFKEKDRIYDAYKTALDVHYKKLKLEGEEKEKVMFQARLDTLAASPNASKLYDKEKQDLRNKINEIKSEITQYENNLGFFANSKGANALKEEVERKIKASQNKIDSLKRKLKLIPNE